MPIVPPRRPDVVRLWSDVVADAEAAQPESTPTDRRVPDAYEFSHGVRKRQGTGPYAEGERPDRN